MSSWRLIRCMRGPAFLILLGVTALLNQWGVLSFGRSWPLYLILAGVLGLAERAAIVAAPPAVPAAYSGYPPGGYGAPPAYTGPAPAGAPVPPSGLPTGDPLADPNRRP